MSNFDDKDSNIELDDCPEISDEQMKIMSLVLSRPGVRETRERLSTIRAWKRNASNPFAVSWTP